MMGTLRDMCDIKQAEETLQKSQKELEDKVKQRTKELKIRNKQLEELNTTLKVVLSKKEEDKNYLEESILSNVKKRVLSYLEKLNLITWFELVFRMRSQFTTSHTLKTKAVFWRRATIL